MFWKQKKNKEKNDINTIKKEEVDSNLLEPSLFAFLNKSIAKTKLLHLEEIEPNKEIGVFYENVCLISFKEEQAENKHLTSNFPLQTSIMITNQNEHPLITNFNNYDACRNFVHPLLQVAKFSNYLHLLNPLLLFNGNAFSKLDYFINSNINKQLAFNDLKPLLLLLIELDHLLVIFEKLSVQANFLQTPIYQIKYGFLKEGKLQDTKNNLIIDFSIPSARILLQNQQNPNDFLPYFTFIEPNYKLQIVSFKEIIYVLANNWKDEFYQLSGSAIITQLKLYFQTALNYDVAILKNFELKTITTNPPNLLLFFNCFKTEIANNGAIKLINVLMCAKKQTNSQTARNNIIKNLLNDVYLPLDFSSNLTAYKDYLYTLFTNNTTQELVQIANENEQTNYYLTKPVLNYENNYLSLASLQRQQQEANNCDVLANEKFLMALKGFIKIVANDGKVKSFFEELKRNSNLNTFYRDEELNNYLNTKYPFFSYLHNINYTNLYFKQAKDEQYEEEQFFNDKNQTTNNLSNRRR